MKFWVRAKFRPGSPLLRQHAKYKYLKLYLIICKCELVKATLAQPIARLSNSQ